MQCMYEGLVLEAGLSKEEWILVIDTENDQTLAI